MATHRNSINNSHRLPLGYSLVELLLTITIGTIMAAMAIPAFSTMLESNRITTQIHEFIGQINYARSSAIRNAAQVVFCKSDDGDTCNSNAEWSDGWIIFIDTTRNYQRDDDEPLLRLRSKRKTSLDFRAFGSDDYVAFQSTGMLRKGNGTFTFCSNDNAIPPRAVVIAKTGRVRISRVKPGGKPLECPE